MSAPLDGIRVLDLSSGVAGPYCAKLLGDLGASVVKVEGPEGDASRRLGPFLGDEAHPEKSGAFLFLNAGKRGVAIDTGSAEGRTWLLGAAREADVLVESFGPGGLEALNLAPADLWRSNRGLIITSLSPFGLSGPYARDDADELMLLAMSGWLNQVGEPGRPPLKTAGNMAGMTIPGLYGVYATLAALAWRRRSGLGQRIDIGAMEALLSASRYFEITYEQTGQLVQRLGAGEILPSSDGYIALSPGIGDKWEVFLALADRPDLADELRAGSFAARMGRLDSLNKALREWAASLPKMEAFHAAQELGIIAGAVANIDEVPSLAPVRERGIFVEMSHPVAGKYRAPGPAFLMSGSPYRVPAPAPLLGQHNEAAARGGVWQSRGADSSPPGEAGPGGDGWEATPELPLSGIRAIELSTFWAGPLAGQYLADLGAEVIKVEAVQRLDPWRLMFNQRDAALPYETGCCYNTVNRNKLGLTLNLGDARGRDLLLRLVAQSDVFLTNLAPRTIANLGLSYERLAEANPRIIGACISGFGSSGAWRDYVSIGSTAEALSGLASITGYEDGPPLRHGTWLSDALAALNCAIGVLVALAQREVTDKGQLVDVSQLDVMIQCIADAFMDLELNGRVWGRHGNADPVKCPYGVYPCLGDDAWVAISVPDETSWRALARLIGRDDWGREGEAWRRRNRAAIDEALSAWTSSLSKQDAAQRLRRAGILAAPVMTPVDLLGDPHLKARGYFEMVERAHVGVRPYVGVIPKFSRTPCHIRKAAPTLGEDNDYVLGKILGLPAAEVVQLETERVIGTKPLA